MTLILPMAASYITGKVVEKLTGESGSMASEVGKELVNKVTMKVFNKEIFKKKVSDLSVEELQGLLNTQVEEFREILFNEARLHMGANEANELVSGVAIELKSKLNTIDSTIDGLEKLLFEARKEWRSQRDIIGTEWGKFSEEFFGQIEEMQESQLATIVNTLTDNLSAIEAEIKNIKLEMVKQTTVIQQTQELISSKFEKLEFYLQQIGAMKIDDGMDTASLHQKYKTILNSITCPDCQFTTSEISDEATWICPSCKETFDFDTKEKVRYELNHTKLIALSVFNQAMTIKNSRGDIQFLADEYVPRKEVEEEFGDFQLKNQKGYSKFRIFLLLGDVGVGKTWAAAAICDKYSRSFPVFYFSLRGPVLQEMKALFLENPKYYGIQTVFEKIREARKRDKKLRILFVFDGFDEVYEEDKQRWFIYEILKTLRKIPGVIVLVTCRKYDWFENRFYKQESGWLDVLTWKKGGVNLTTYSDEEYQKVMEPLEIIAPLEEWEEHWGDELKKPFLQAIVQKLVFDAPSPQFIQINNPRFFELLEKRLGIVNTDHPILVQFAENSLSKAKYLTRTSFEDQKSISGLLSAGLVKEKERAIGGYNPFPELGLSGPFEETYCHYLRFWTVRLNEPHKLPEVWQQFIDHPHVFDKVKEWVTLLVQGHPDISNLLQVDLETVKPVISKPKVIVKEDITSEIMKNIGILESIYKKKQLSILRLANKIQLDVNQVIETLETLIANNRLRGHIDDQGSVNVEQYILVLEEDWHIEELEWMELKKQIDSRKQNWIQNYQVVQSSLADDAISDYKLANTSKQIDDLEEVFESWKETINTINEKDFVTEVTYEVNVYLEENLPILEDAFKKLAILDQEWKQQEREHTEETMSSLDNLEVEIGNNTSHLNSLYIRLQRFQEESPKSILELGGLNSLITDFKNILANYHQIQQKLEQFEGKIIHSIRERKQKLTNDLRTQITTIQESISTCNDLISNFYVERRRKSGLRSNYNGQLLCELDADFLQELELLLGVIIPFIDQVEWNSFGFTVQNDRISGLSLYAKNLNSLPNKLSNLHDSIEVLNLRNNQFSTVPQSIFLLEQLKILHLENNQISNIPEEIKTLKNLEELYLYNNILQSIPIEIFQLNTLHYLNLNSNNLSKLPEPIDFNEIKVLDLFNNQITLLPNSITLMTRLETLYIGKNQFSMETDAIIERIESRGGKVIR